MWTGVGLVTLHPWHWIANREAELGSNGDRSYLGEVSGWEKGGLSRLISRRHTVCGGGNAGDPGSSPNTR